MLQSDSAAAGTSPSAKVAMSVDVCESPGYKDIWESQINATCYTDGCLYPPSADCFWDSYHHYSYGLLHWLVRMIQRGEIMDTTQPGLQYSFSLFKILPIGAQTDSLL